MERSSQPDLNRIRQLASELAAADVGTTSQLVGALAETVVGLSERVEGLWQLISAIVESAGLDAPSASGPPSEFTQALASARSSGRRGVRLTIDGKEWVAALSQQQTPTADPVAWSAIQRLARESSDQDDM
jgi:hypothetical protein